MPNCDQCDASTPNHEIEAIHHSQTNEQKGSQRCSANMIQEECGRADTIVMRELNEQRDTFGEREENEKPDAISEQEESEQDDADVDQDEVAQFNDMVKGIAAKGAQLDEKVNEWTRRYLATGTIPKRLTAWLEENYSELKPNFSKDERCN